MAIAACRECHQSISTEATACPHCGAPNPAGASTRPLSPQKSGGGFWGEMDVVRFIGTVLILGLIVVGLASAC